MTENIKKIINILTTKPGYKKTGKRALAQYLQVTEEDIEEAKKIMKDNPAVTEYEAFKEEHGITQEKVGTVWYKGKHLSVRTDERRQIIDIDEVVKRIKNYKPPENPTFKDYNTFLNDRLYSNFIGIINLYDAHVDKLSYVGDGGKQELMDNLETLWAQFKILVQEVLEYGVSNIIFPVGHDFFNTNGREKATRAGTPQDRTVNWYDSFEAGIGFYRQCIDYLKNYTEVDVVMIPGNHDHDLVLSLGSVLKVIYENNPKVTIHANKDTRKYITKGDCLFGFGHGKVEKRRLRDVPTAMAIESPNFSTTKYRMFLLGDIHHSEEYTMLNKMEHNGVEIRFFRPTTNTDEWHQESLWIGNRKSISAVVVKEDGSKVRSLENFF